MDLLFQALLQVINDHVVSIQVDLVGHNDLGFLGQGLAVLAQLTPDAAVIIHGIGPIHRCYVQHMGQEGGPLNMPEEF
jgi:hypothetical protein